ncbi:MAG: T9SS type A sorting domain-containing protein [Bacteroidia bacterium]|nr:T9SS type A sorting domain-containing protein [Bacteroidia bacterium]
MKTSSILLSALFAAFFMVFAPKTSIAQVIEEGEFVYTPYDDVDDIDNEDTENSKLKNANQPLLTASPNPSYGDVLKIWYSRLTGSSKISVYDANGKLYHTTHVGSSRESQGVVNFSIANLAAGLYIIQLSDGINNVIQKVIIR